MKTVKRLLAMFFAICLSMAVAVPAFAGSPNESKNGVLQMTLQVFVDSEEIYRSSGTAFLINENHVITNYHVIGLSTDDVQVLDAISAAGADVEISYRVYTKRDVHVEAFLVEHASSADMDFAVLELANPIGGRTPLALADSDTAEDTDTVFALGFPVASQQAQDIVYHDTEDVTATKGVISKSLEVDGVDYFQHDATVSNGSSGGPLVDEDGNVLGINTIQGVASQEFYVIDESGVAVHETYGHIDFNGAIKINEVKEVLQSANIEYKDVEAPDPEPSEEVEPTDDPVEPEEPEEPEVDKSELEDIIDEAETLDSSEYTSDSWGVLESNLESAEEVLDDDAVSQAMVDKKVESLEEAIDQLEVKEEGNNLIMIIGAAAAVVVILIIILVVTLSKGGKSKAQPANIPSNVPNMSTAPNNIPNPNMHRNIPPVNPYPAATMDEGAGETSVLSEGAGETTVLGGGAAGGAYMIRVKTGEKVVLNSPNFTIGKEKRRVNYCISDNTSISRCHARISKRGAQYFITDMNSTNFTFVNGAKLVANMETPLAEGAKIRISDEDFEFHVN